MTKPGLHRYEAMISIFNLELARPTEDFIEVRATDWRDARRKVIAQVARKGYVLRNTHRHDVYDLATGKFVRTEQRYQDPIGFPYRPSNPSYDGPAARGHFFDRH